MLLSLFRDDFVVFVQGWCCCLCSEMMFLSLFRDDLVFIQRWSCCLRSGMMMLSLFRDDVAFVQRLHCSLCSGMLQNQLERKVKKIRILKLPKSMRMWVLCFCTSLWTSVGHSASHALPRWKDELVQIFFFTCPTMAVLGFFVPSKADVTYALESARKMGLWWSLL